MNIQSFNYVLAKYNLKVVFNTHHMEFELIKEDPASFEVFCLHRNIDQVKSWLEQAAQIEKNAKHSPELLFKRLKEIVN